MSKWSIGFRWLLDQWWLELKYDNDIIIIGFRWLLDQWWLEHNIVS